MVSVGTLFIGKSGSKLGSWLDSAAVGVEGQLELDARDFPLEPATGMLSTLDQQLAAQPAAGQAGVSDASYDQFGDPTAFPLLVSAQPLDL